MIGSTIADKYELLEQIGTGSMGTVYRARHNALDRDVALKLMAPEVAHDRAFAARFRREAHAASRLSHPNSVMITDFGEEPDGLLYLVMEYVRGPSLETMLERGDRLSEHRIVDILSQVLSAVAVAHTAGIVHRDLKPANVIVVETTDDDGRSVDVVKVCDFGVAALRDRADLITSTSRHQALRANAPGAKQLTLAGCVVGTPAYMAPEQASGNAQDGRTDLYSLGIVLFEMLTGKLPLWGETLEDTMRRQIDTPAPSPQDYVECTPELAAVCLRALCKDPADRYASARAMRRALRAALSPQDSTASSDSLDATDTGASLAGVAAISNSVPPPKRRTGVSWPWVAAALAAGAVASFTWLSNGRPLEAEAHQLVNRAERLLPVTGQPLAPETALPPDRDPLVVARPKRALAAAAPAAESSAGAAPVHAHAPSRVARAAKVQPEVPHTEQLQQDPTPPTVAADESDGAQLVAADTAPEAAANVVSAQPADSESARTDSDTAFATRH